MSLDIAEVRPIELPTTAEPSSYSTTGLPGRDAETTAQTANTTGEADTVEQDEAEVVDHRGEGFALDLGDSRAPAVLFSVLTGLAVLLGAFATAALPVQIGAGAIAAGAGALAIRAAARRTRHH